MWLDLPLIAAKAFALLTVSNYSTESPKGSVHGNVSKFNPIQNSNAVYEGRGGGNILQRSNFKSFKAVGTKLGRYMIFFKLFILVSA